MTAKSAWQTERRARPKPSEGRVMEDFDVELLGKKVALLLKQGGWVEGTVAARSRFWLKILINDKNIYINKSNIVLIEVEKDG